MKRTTGLIKMWPKNKDLLLVLNLANRVLRIGKHCLAIHYRMFGRHKQELLRWQDFSIIAYHYMNKICVWLHAKVCSTIFQFRLCLVRRGKSKRDGFVNILGNNAPMTWVLLNWGITKKKKSLSKEEIFPSLCTAQSLNLTLGPKCSCIGRFLCFKSTKKETFSTTWAWMHLQSSSSPYTLQPVCTHPETIKVLTFSHFYPFFFNISYHSGHFLPHREDPRWCGTHLWLPIVWTIPQGGLGVR